MRLSDLTGAHLHQVDDRDRDRACGMDPHDIDEARWHEDLAARDRYDDMGPARESER